jgi:hypothetical protein
VVRVDPVVEHQHVVAGQQNRVSLLHLAAVDARANVLRIWQKQAQSELDGR